MKKIFLSALIISAFVAANSFAASMTDEFGRPINTTAKGKNGELSVCEKACPGYSLEIVTCPSGFTIATCGSKGCQEYKKCEKDPCQEGFDTSLKTCPIETQEDDYLCTRCM